MQVFNVSLGVTGLTNPEAKTFRGKTYAMQIADTVIVQKRGQANEVATATATKSFDRVSYNLDEVRTAACSWVRVRQESLGLRRRCLMPTVAWYCGGAALF